MALEIKFKRNTGQDGDIVLTDITGDYDATTNLTGYGAPNLERSAVNIVPFVKFGQNQNNLPAETYAPDAAETITVPIVGDGVYNVTVYALPVAYDYTGASEDDLVSNAVSLIELGECLSDVFAIRKYGNLYEEFRSDSCKSKDSYKALMDYILLEIRGAMIKLANDSGTQAHSIMTALTTYINKSRI